MKKGVAIITVLFLVMFLSVGLVSANWFSDFFGKITGHVVQGPTEGLVAYYPLDGSSNDASGNDNPGVWSGTESYVDGKIGQAASFDGSSSIVSQNNLGIVGNSPRTISYWSYTAAGTSSVITPEGYGGQNQSDMDYLVYNYGGSGGKGYCFGVWNGMGSCSTGDISQDAWHMVTETSSGSLRNLYIDTVLVASYAASFDTTDTPLSIGATYGFPSYYTGLIDDFRVYNRVLAQSEINELYVLGGETPICNPSWSAWSNCSLTCGNGTQTRTDGCGTTQTQICNPQSCNLPVCIAFNYSNWGVCNSSSVQTRTVTSTIPAVCANGNPLLIQSCTYVPNQTTCVANSSCTVIPLICPEEGKQTKTCAKVSSNCTTSVSTEEINCSVGNCAGCTVSGKCVEAGFRITESGIPRYCDSTSEFIAQKADNSTCQNNYECLSNQCSDSTCVSLVNEIRGQKNLLVRIICWLSHPVDLQAREDCIATFS